MSEQKKEPTTDQVNEILSGVSPMIWSILSGYGGLSNQDREDLKQEVLVYLWEHVLPQYTPGRAKFSSFAYRCAVNFINRKLFSSNRKSNNVRVAIDRFQDILNDRNNQSNSPVEDKCKALEIIIRKKDGLLKPKEVVVLSLMRDNPYITQKDIAEIMGYNHPSAISMMMTRMRKKIKNVRIFDEL